MSKKAFRLLGFVLLLCVLLLCGCAQKKEAAIPDVTAQPTPAPTPVPPPPPTSYTLAAESPEDILALASQENLQRVDGTKSREYAALAELQALRPDCDVRWVYPFQGTDYPSSTTELSVSDLNGLEDAIRYLPKLERIDLSTSDATLADLDRFDAVRPGIFYLWNFDFGGYHLRTDISVFSTMRDGYGRRYTDAELYPILKYCRHLKALDLGHNALSDVSLIGELSDLEVLVLSGNPITDARPLGNLSNLRYLELFACPEITDFSFLNRLTRLEDLNLCYDSCTDLSFLGSMPNFRFGSFKYSGISAENFKEWQAKLPEATLVFWDFSDNSFDGGWRDSARSYQVRTAFSAWRHIREYRGIGDFDMSPGKYYY